MRSRQVSLPRLRWRTTPGSSEPGARRRCASARMVSTSRSSGAHASSAAAGRLLPAAGVISANTCPASTLSPAASGWTAATTPSQDAATCASIFMALTVSKVSPAATASPSRAWKSITVPAIEAATACCPGWAVSAAALAGTLAGTPPGIPTTIACWRNSAKVPLPPGCTARSSLSCGDSVSNVVRASPPRTAGWSRIALSCLRFVATPAT